MSRSAWLFDRARRVIPGGVNSPVRAFGAVGGSPPFVARGEGPYVIDADGRRLIDYVQSWGALLFGHARPEIVEEVVRAARAGTSFGAPTEGEVELAETLTRALPGLEMVRLVSSGTEAAMSAVRLARAVTGRAGVVKFDGCYHGHSDALLVRAGSGVATLGLPGSAGVTAGAAGDTAVVPYNDLAAAGAELLSAPGGVACLIVEPVAANMGVVPPSAGFLEGLRELCDQHGTLLVFDEVITGFRVGYGGVQTLCGVRPDLTVLGKVIGGGLPLAAFGGRRELMERVAPAGDVYQAGTLSGNPVAVAAGLAALRLARELDPYPELIGRAKGLADGLAAAFEAAGVPVTVNRFESLLSLFFRSGPVAGFAGARAADHDLYARFFHEMLEVGIALPPSGFEAWFPGAAHGDAEIERTIEQAARAARALARPER